MNHLGHRDDLLSGFADIKARHAAGWPNNAAPGPPSNVRLTRPRADCQQSIKTITSSKHGPWETTQLHSSQQLL